MTSSNPSLCLNMIVKNERANLERCLASVADHISCWVIGDTGSTDGTQDLIKDFFAGRGIPGELHSFPFENFEQARNEALTRARASALRFDYLLLTDADMELVVEDPAFAVGMKDAAYRVLQRGGVSYWNLRLLRRRIAASYRGVTHEYLDIRQGKTRHLTGLYFIDHATGSNRVDKYARDIRLLENAITTESDKAIVARYRFYLANTFRDKGDLAEALAAYEDRAGLGHWQEEVFVSLLNAARIKETLQYPKDDIIAAFQAATDARPTRAEALHGAAKFCRSNDMHEQGYDFAARGLLVAYPAEGLFVEDWIYQYGLLDELAVTAYWTGRYVECVAANDQLLAEGKLPADHRERIAKNRQFAIDKLPGDGSSIELGASSASTADAELEPANEAPERSRAASLRPNPRAYWLRVAQTYRDADQTKDAVEAYAKQAAIPGLDEETWDARLQAAFGLRELGDEAGFLRAALAAFNDRASRAEPLYALARYYREHEMYELAAYFAESGLALPRPDPASLFVDEFVYSAGLIEELSIAGNHSQDPARKDSAYAACNALALSRDVPKSVRDLACSNLDYYMTPAGQMMPSFAHQPVPFDPPDGWYAMNPSIARRGEQLFLVQRCVNYIKKDDQAQTPDGGPIKTRNFLLELDNDLKALSRREILPPQNMAPALSTGIQGFEDARLFTWRGALWCSAAFCEANAAAWPEQVLARIDDSEQHTCQMTDFTRLFPDSPRRIEKNWMPRLRGDVLEFVYSCDPTRIVDGHGKTRHEAPLSIAGDQFRGGSQAIAFDDGWLALIHEARVKDGARYYRHRFVWFDQVDKLHSVSRPFFFEKFGIEFAAGLAWHPDGKRLLITYGIDDRLASIASVEADEVRPLLKSVDDVAAGSGLHGGERNASLYETSATNSRCHRGRESPDDSDRSQIERLEPPFDDSQTQPINRQRASDEMSPEIRNSTEPASVNDKRQTQIRATNNKLSGFVITYNKAEIIETCLRSLRFADELIVIDKSSTDGTREIAQKHADRVVVVPWTPTADDTRIYALSLCSHDLIVYLDDDECLSPDAIRFLLEETKNPTIEVCQFPSRDYYLGIYDKRRRDWPDYKARYFRRGALEFSPTVHKCIVIKSTNPVYLPADSPICLYHFTSPNVSSWIEKANRYTSEADRESWFAPTAPLSIEFVNQSVGYWLNGEHAMADGYPTAYALMRVAYDIIDRLKRWEMATGIDGAAEFSRLCAILQTEYALLDRERGAPFAPAGLLTPETAEAAPAPASFANFEQLLAAARRCEEAGRSDQEVLDAYLRAHNADPMRVEGLHGATRYCREKGLIGKGIELAAKGLEIPYPQKLPPGEEWIYEYGFQQEFSIVANYASDPIIKDRGFAVCDWLALNRHIPAEQRNLALSNLHFYLGPLATLMPSFKTQQLQFSAPGGYSPMNPSIARNGDELVMIIRCVNSKLDEKGQSKTVDRAPFLTRNFLVRLDARLEIRSSIEILPPDGMTELVDPTPPVVVQRPVPRWRDGGDGRGPSYPQFEDMRPFYWRADLWCLAAMRELSYEGWYEPVIARIDEATPDCAHLKDWRILRAEKPPGHQKNWMPFLSGDTLRFIGLCDPVWLLDHNGRTVSESAPEFSADQFRGSSQAVRFDSGYLAIVHETRILSDGKRNYRHRFVWFDEGIVLRSATRPFFFCEPGVEFAAGLAWHSDERRLIVTYGIGDREAWLATIDRGDVRSALEHVDDRTSRTSILPAIGAGGDYRMTTASSNNATKVWQQPRETTPIFIHSSWRTSSTWLFSKFRDQPGTNCFYEPFNEHLRTMTRQEASEIGPLSRDYHHPPTLPYFLEYMSIIDEAGGIPLFKGEMALDWFIPIGGLRGKLRPPEVEYFEALFRHSESLSKRAVFAATRSLGRAWAMKRTWGGYHILLHRNLWRQWESYLYYRNEKVTYFYDTVAFIVSGGDDPFFEYLVNYYLGPMEKEVLSNTDGDYRQRGRLEKVSLLQRLPENMMFSIFASLHIYLYLHAALSVDLTIDVTRVVHDIEYRRSIEAEVKRSTDLAISLSDVVDRQNLDNPIVRVEQYGFDDLKTHLGTAVRVLAEFGEADQFASSASAFLDATMREYLLSQKKTLLSDDSSAQVPKYETHNADGAVLDGEVASDEPASFRGADIERLSGSMEDVNVGPCGDRSQPNAPFPEWPPLSQTVEQSEDYHPLSEYKSPTKPMQDSGLKVLAISDYAQRGNPGKSPSFFPRSLIRFVKPLAASNLLHLDQSATGSSSGMAWTPPAPAAGTELMLKGLRSRLSHELDQVDLFINRPSPERSDKRPRIVWVHHNVNESYMDWCRDKEITETVDCFVFVSYWQKQRYIDLFSLPQERCVVLRNATDVNGDHRRWEPGSITRCAYISTPFRGLDVLLNAWEQLKPVRVELHIWSSMKLYLHDDAPYEHLFQRARCTPGVTYHGLLPNDELRQKLRSMHFLTFPSTFEETSCLSVIEAMAAGCRVIVPSLGALPETTAGFARIYPFDSDRSRHASTFARVLGEELSNPWGDQPDTAILQQLYCELMYDWGPRLDEWRSLIRLFYIDSGQPNSRRL